MFHILKSAAGACGVALVLCACSNGQIGVEPPRTIVDVAGTTSLQFAVGTARFAANGATYLNTLATYRQPNGLSGTLYNTPLVTGPAGFVVPAAGSAGTDAGTNHISGTAPTQPGLTAVATTFGQTGGAFAYGFAPENSVAGGTATYPGGNGTPFGNALGAANISFSYTQPLYGSSAFRLPFLLGPPAVPDFHNGTFPVGFLGYPSGFVAFAAAPVAGQYNLSVIVPGGAPDAAPVAVKTATAILATATGLPLITTPVVIRTTGGGGASFTVAPRPAGTSNQVLYVADVDASGTATFYSFDATGAGVFALSATAGPKGTAPFANGDEIAAWVVASDYNILSLGPPGNLQQTPALPAQADITVSAPNITGYDTSLPAGTILSVKRGA